MKSALFTSRLCGQRDDQLPYPQDLDFSRMQQHAVEVHGFSREDLEHTRREEIPFGARWPLPNGRPWLRATKLLI